VPLPVHRLPDSLPLRLKPTIMAIPSHPRRRAHLTASDAKPSLVHSSKASTFHQSRDPPSADLDPVLDFPSLPGRSSTSAQQLQDLVNSHESRVEELIGALESGLRGLGSFCKETIQGSVAETRLSGWSPPDTHMAFGSKSPPSVSFQSDEHKPTSVGGTGSSVASKFYESTMTEKGTICLSFLKCQYSNPTASSAVKLGGINESKAAFTMESSQRAISEFACKQIQKHIISPIIREERLKAFHPLVGGLPHRVARKEITCLRDLEKILLWLAPVSDH